MKKSEDITQAETKENIMKEAEDIKPSETDPSFFTKRLSNKLPPEWIEKIKKGNRPELSYVPIDKVLRRLNEVCGDYWNIEIIKTDIYNHQDTTSAIVQVSLTICDPANPENIISVRHGIGADKKRGTGDTDIDKIVKTAYANAIKKAANMYGVALELWDDIIHSSSESQPNFTAKEEPKLLSDEAREKVTEFCTTHGITKTELTEYLEMLRPASKGNPTFFSGNETQLQIFLQEVEEELKKSHV